MSVLFLVENRTDTNCVALGPTPEVQGGFPSAPRPTALSCCPKMGLISLNDSEAGLRQLAKTDVARP